MVSKMQYPPVQAVDGDVISYMSAVSPGNGTVYGYTTC